MLALKKRAREDTSDKEPTGGCLGGVKLAGAMCTAAVLGGRPSALQGTWYPLCTMQGAFDCEQSSHFQPYFTCIMAQKEERTVW